MQKVIQFLIKTNSVFPLLWLYFLLAGVHNEAVLIIRLIILAAIFFLLGLDFVSKKVPFDWKIELVLNKKVKTACAWIEFVNMLLLVIYLIIHQKNFFFFFLNKYTINKFIVVFLTYVGI